MDNIKKRLKVLQYIYFSTFKALTNKDNNLDYDTTFDVCGNICKEILTLMLKLYTDFNMSVDEIIGITNIVFKSSFMVLING